MTNPILHALRIPRGSRIRWGFTIFWVFYFSWFIGCVAVPAVRWVVK